LANVFEIEELQRLYLDAKVDEGWKPFITYCYDHMPEIIEKLRRERELVKLVGMRRDAG
jgi:hypothetical protein